MHLPQELDPTLRGMESKGSPKDVGEIVGFEVAAPCVVGERSYLGKLVAGQSARRTSRSSNTIGPHDYRLCNGIRTFAHSPVSHNASAPRGRQCNAADSLKSDLSGSPALFSQIV